MSRRLGTALVAAAAALLFAVTTSPVAATASPSLTVKTMSCCKV